VHHANHSSDPASTKHRAAALDAYFSAVPKARSYVLDDQGRLRRHVAVFVDGELLTDKTNLKLAVAAQTEIYVMQALSGG
jgi:molybdopterin synthase sulfur carrier subunit